MRSKLLAGLMSGVLTVNAIPLTSAFLTTEVSAVETVAQSVTKVSVVVGKSKTISVKGAKKNNVTFDVSKTGIVNLKCSKNGKVTIKGIKAGKITVIAKSKNGKELGRYVITVQKEKALNNIFSEMYKDINAIDSENMSISSTFNVALDTSDYARADGSKETLYKGTLDVTKKGDKGKIEIGLDTLYVMEEAVEPLTTLVKEEVPITGDKCTILIDGDTYYVEMLPLLEMCVGADMMDSSAVEVFKQAQIGWVTFMQDDIIELMNQGTVQAMGEGAANYNHGSIRLTEENMKAISDVIGDFAVILDKNLNELSLVKQKNGTYSITLNAKSESKYIKMFYNLVKNDLEGYLSNAAKALGSVEADPVANYLSQIFAVLNEQLKEDKKEILKGIKDSKLGMKDSDLLKMSYKKNKTSSILNFNIVADTVVADIQAKIGKASDISFSVPNAVTLEEAQNRIEMIINSVEMQ